MKFLLPLITLVMFFTSSHAKHTSMFTEHWAENGNNDNLFYKDHPLGFLIVGDPSTSENRLSHEEENKYCTPVTDEDQSINFPQEDSKDYEITYMTEYNAKYPTNNVLYRFGHEIRRHMPSYGQIVGNSIMTSKLWNKQLSELSYDDMINEKEIVFEKKYIEGATVISSSCEAITFKPYAIVILLICVLMLSFDICHYKKSKKD